MESAFELRIVLAIIAVIIIAALYVWYRATSKDQILEEIDLDELGLTEELDDIPSMLNDHSAELMPDDLRSEFQGVSKEMREETISKRVQEAKQARADAIVKTPISDISKDKELIIVCHVVARDQQVFTGPMLVQMMSDLELEHGEMGVFHYNIERFERKQSVYCIANMLKPGTFELETMNSFETRGLTMILQLPGPEDELKSFNIMIEHAQRLATFLNGDLLDENRNPMTKQTISQYKEQVQLFGLRATKKTGTA